MVRTRSRTFARAALLLGLLASVVGGCESCLKRLPRESVPLLPYPGCAEGVDAGAPQLITEQVLRAGPGHPTPELVERYRIERRGCHVVITVRQEWSRQIDDVEVVYDARYRPVRAWKRMSVPSLSGRSPLVDTRRYELRTMPVSMSARSGDRLQHYEFKRRARPIAVVGPGRGLFSAWIAAQPLDVNRSVHGPVLDFRDPMERLETVALRREDDAQVPGLGRVRVYTVFGHESVFTDSSGFVVGDLAGLRPASLVRAPMPPPMRTESPPDPVHTP